MELNTPETRQEWLARRLARGVPVGAGEAARALALVLEGVPPEEWPEDLAGVAAASDAWPAFDALAGLPLALIRGANSDLLTAETAAAMRHRRPDMHFAEVPDRGHVPWLDEPEALAAIRAWIGDLG